MKLPWNPRSIVQLYQRNPILVITRSLVVLVSLGLIYTLVQVFLHWQKLSELTALPSPAETPKTESITTPTEESPDETIDVQELSEWHIFGKPGTSIDKLTGKIIDPSEIPLTALQITLKGVLSTDGKGKGSAIIADKEGKDKFYVVGATLPGPAVLRAVYPDRILLEYRGRLETLWFEPPEAAKAAPEPKREGGFMEGFGRSPLEEEFEEFEEFEEEEE